MASRKKIIVANWKMNPSTLKEANELFLKTKTIAAKTNGVTVVVCPPAIFAGELAKKTKGNRVYLGAQDLFWQKGTGPYTGSVSAEMLAALGVQYIIIGHSERRALGDSDEIVNKKLSAALSAGLVAILCIGESVRDEHGEYLEFLKNQIKQALARIPRKYFLNLAIAYEPLWAIGEHATGADSPEAVYELSIFIRKQIAEIVGRDIALSLPIIYGGSVDEKNAADFFSRGGVQGLLPGRASLNSEKLRGIIKAAQAQ